MVAAFAAFLVLGCGLALIGRAAKKYGDKIDATLQGPDGGPIQEHLVVEYIRQKNE